MSDTKTKLSNKDAEKKIQKIVESGNIIFTNHCREQMKDRTLNTDDLVFLLRNGKINKPPEYDQKNWKYRVEGKIIDGDECAVITAIVGDNVLLCITAWGQ